MAEAWMVRGSERQELLSSLKRDIYEVQEALNSQLFMVGMAQHLLLAIHSDGNDPESENHVMRAVYRQQILPKVFEFARCSEEKEFLLSQLLVWAVEQIHNGFQHSLSRVEILDPKLVFHASSAMVEVFPK